MTEPKSSGEFSVLVLDLLKEQRSDMKSVVAATNATAVAVAAMEEKQAAGEQRMDEHHRRLRALERAAEIDDAHPRHRASHASSQRRIDYAWWVKAGLFAGAVLAGIGAGKAIPS